MNFLKRLFRYPIGAIVKRPGRLFLVKTKDGWLSRQRAVWMSSRNETLEKGDRVFFVDGNPENVDPQNLAKIKFHNVQYRFREQSGCVYIPNKEESKS